MVTSRPLFFFFFFPQEVKNNFSRFSFFNSPPHFKETSIYPPGITRMTPPLPSLELFSRFLFIYFKGWKNPFAPNLRKTMSASDMKESCCFRHRGIWREHHVCSVFRNKGKHLLFFYCLQARIGKLRARWLFTRSRTLWWHFKNKLKLLSTVAECLVRLPRTC